MMGMSHISQVHSQHKPPSDTTTAALHRCIWSMFDLLTETLQALQNAQTVFLFLLFFCSLWFIAEKFGPCIFLRG